MFGAYLCFGLSVVFYLGLFCIVGFTGWFCLWDDSDLFWLRMLNFMVCFFWGGVVAFFGCV